MKTYVGIFIFSHVMTWCRIKNRGAPTSPRQPPKQPKTSLHRRTTMSPPPYHCSPMAAEAQMVESSPALAGRLPTAYHSHVHALAGPKRRSRASNRQRLLPCSLVGNQKAQRLLGPTMVFAAAVAPFRRRLSVLKVNSKVISKRHALINV